MYELQEIPSSTCRGLLESGVVGRVAVCTPSGPQIFTVNYAVVDESIIFRTTPDGVLGTFATDAPVAFQIDSFEDEYHRCWSVQATGRALAVERTEDLGHIRSIWEPRPWAAGARDLYLRLAWDELTGRQLGTGWDPRRQLRTRRSVEPSHPRGT